MTEHFRYIFTKMWEENCVFDCTSVLSLLSLDGAAVDDAGVALGGDGWRVTSPRPGSLRIRDARAEDSGRYLCQAVNGVNPPISKTVTLSVLGSYLDPLMF